MPKPRFLSLELEQQREILRLASQEFVEHGLESASMNRIITLCGISKGAMYYYFDDKADLYITVMEWVMQQQAEMMTQTPANLPFWEQIHSWAHQGMEFTLQRPEVWAFTRSFFKVRRESLGERHEDLVSQWRTQSEGLIQIGQQSGAVRTDLEIALLVALMINLGETFERWWVEFYDSPDQETRDRIVNMGLDLSKRLLGTPQVVRETIENEEDTP